MVQSEFVIGTYNMSWASDQYNNQDERDNDKAKISEYSFLLKNKDNDLRLFWKNSKDNLLQFIENKKPAAIGLQEINKTDNSDDGGSAAIDADLPENYKQICKTVTSKITTTGNTGAVVGISIIFDKEKLGDVEENNIQIVDNSNQTGYITGGRPLLLVLTNKNFLLVNIHGAQEPNLGENMDDFNKYMVKNNKKFIEDKVNEFLNTRTNPDVHIFVMGDFNDRYDGIKVIEIAGQHLKYQGPAPKSCCHNWDSSCKNDRYIQFGSSEYGRCNKKNENGEPLVNDEKTEIPDNEVVVSNYRYRGDKVFGKNPVTTMEIYNNDTDYLTKVSNKSDHELVYATFSTEEPTTPTLEALSKLAGGKSTRKGKKSKKAGKKSKKNGNKGGKKSKRRNY